MQITQTIGIGSISSGQISGMGYGQWPGQRPGQPYGYMSDGSSWTTPPLSNHPPVRQTQPPSTAAQLQNCMLIPQGIAIGNIGSGMGSSTGCGHGIGSIMPVPHASAMHIVPGTSNCIGNAMQTPSPTYNGMCGGGNGTAGGGTSVCVIASGGMNAGGLGNVGVGNRIPSCRPSS